MKSLFLAITFLMGAVSTAADSEKKAQGVLQYKVTGAKYASAHVQNATRAQLVLNYDKAEVSLNIKVAFNCPDGRVCAQVMPVPVQVELPIISIDTDMCGIRTVLAELDNRPADGELQQIKIVDPSQITCRTFVAVQPKATYITSYYDRLDGQTVTNKSTMLLSLQAVKGGNLETQGLLEISLAPPILVKYVLNSGFSPNPTIQTLYVDKVGRVVNTVKVLRTGQVKTTVVAELTADGLKNLKDTVASVPVDAKLVDANEGEPRCTDAPSSAISVRVENQDVVVFQRAGCHNFSVETSSAYELRDLMQGLLSLTR